MKKKKKEKKIKEPHIVPLSRQAIVILRALYNITGQGKYLFPGRDSPNLCMCNRAINDALRSMGFSKDVITVHGLRATARTMLGEIEELEFNRDIIDLQLAHVVKDANDEAYNRTRFLPQRRVMLQKWADYLEKLSDQQAKIVADNVVNGCANLSANAQACPEEASQLAPSKIFLIEEIARLTNPLASATSAPQVSELQQMPPV
jgi:hypothetical protein